MPKSTKRFVLSTNALNSQGFRMLTDGCAIESFKKNPVMLFNHIRPEGNQRNQILPLGHWEDVQVEGDKITAVPVFDDKDEFAMSIYNKVEAGHIRMASVGASPLATSKKKDLMLPGQKHETVTKWTMHEASIVDVGANPEALSVALYDSNDKLINLSESRLETLIPKIDDTMSSKKTTAGAAFAALKLAKEAGEKAAQLRTAAAEKVELALADEGTSDDEKAQLAEESEPADEDDAAQQMAALQEENKTLKEQLAKLQEQLRLSEEEGAEKAAKALADKAYGLR